MTSSKPTSVVLGAGEIGRAIHALLEPHYPAFLYDILVNGAPHVGKCDYLHICFPYSEVFKSEVERYRDMFHPTHVVVHSTVPIGTCGELGVVHSPVRGKHYDMLRSLRTYTKFFGGEDADAPANLFLRIGVPVAIYDSPEATEMAKILETTFLGLMVRWTQSVDEWARNEGLNFTEVWDKFTSTYNEKAEQMGQPKFPVLVPIHEKIGGHCVLPNLAFLPESFPFKAVVDRGQA